MATENFKVGDFAQIKVNPNQWFNPGYIGKVVRIKSINDHDYYLVEMVNRPSDVDDDDLPLTQYANDADLVAPGETDKFQVGKFYRVLDTARMEANVYSDMQGKIVKIDKIDDDGDYWIELINPANHPGASKRDYIHPERLESALAPVTDTEVEEEMKPKSEAKYKVGDVYYITEEGGRLGNVWSWFREKNVKIVNIDSDGDYWFTYADEIDPSGRDFVNKSVAHQVFQPARNYQPPRKYKVGQAVRIKPSEWTFMPCYRGQFVKVVEIVHDNYVLEPMFELPEGQPEKQYTSFDDKLEPVTYEVGKFYKVRSDANEYDANLEGVFLGKVAKITKIDDDGDYWLSLIDDDGDERDDWISAHKLSFALEPQPVEGSYKPKAKFKEGDVVRLVNAGLTGIPGSHDGREVKILRLIDRCGSYSYKIEALDENVPQRHQWSASEVQLERIA